MYQYNLRSQNHNDVDSIIANKIITIDQLENPIENILIVGATGNDKYILPLVNYGRRKNQPIMSPTYRVHIIEHVRDYYSNAIGTIFNVPWLNFYNGVTAGKTLDNIVSEQWIGEYYNGNGKSEIGKQYLTLHDSLSARQHEYNLVAGEIESNKLLEAFEASGSKSWDVVIFNGMRFYDIDDVGSYFNDTKNIFIHDFNTFYGEMLWSRLPLNSMTRKYIFGSQENDNAYNNNAGIAHFQMPKG